MKIWLFSLLISFSYQTVAGSGPIDTHLREATKLNIKRAKYYARLSQGKSLPLSYELIFMEKLAKVVTDVMDHKAKVYRRAGLALFQDDLIDMKLTPEFSPTFGEVGPPIEKIRFDLNVIRHKMLDLLEEDNLSEIYKLSVELLEEGPLKETNQNCLTRHFVESIARSVFNHENTREKARDLGLDDPKHVLLKFLKTQIINTRWAYSLDKRAFAIQQDNIPLFCQDVPAIPYK